MRGQHDQSLPGLLSCRTEAFSDFAAVACKRWCRAGRRAKFAPIVLAGKRGVGRAASRSERACMRVRIGVAGRIAIRSPRWCSRAAERSSSPVAPRQFDCRPSSRLFVFASNGRSRRTRAAANSRRQVDNKRGGGQRALALGGRLQVDCAAGRGRPCEGRRPLDAPRRLRGREEPRGVTESYSPAGSTPGSKRPVGASNAQPMVPSLSFTEARRRWRALRCICVDNSH